MNTESKQFNAFHEPTEVVPTTRPIEKGTVVKYKDGHMRVTAKFKNTVNLGGIFSGKTKIKGVPLSEVTEDHDAWYESWTQSESYQCM